MNKNKSYIFKPTKAQKNNLEYKHYQKMLSKVLEEHGYKKEEKLHQATYIVSFEYGVDGQSPVVSTIPIFGSTGGETIYHDGYIQGDYGNSAHYSGTSRTPIEFGVVGTRTSSVMEYHRFLRLEIALKHKRNKSPIKVFEGVVRSKGTDATFANVSMCLIKSMFKDFPGINGKIEYVVISADKCMGHTSIYLD